jgi:hypothetical protein
VRPLQRGDDDMFISASNPTIAPVDRDVARRAARLRGA